MRVLVSSIYDGRGVRRDMPMHNAYALRTLAESPVDRARALAHIRSSAFARESFLMLLGPLLFGVIFLAIAVLGDKLVRWERVVAAALGCLGVLAPMFHKRLTRWRAVWIRRVCLPVPQVCPICGYWLGGLKVEPDGCTVCPECGAAWRLEQGGMR